MGRRQRRSRGVVLKSAEDIQAMRAAAEINVEVLQTVKAAIKPGVTTAELDKIAFDILASHKAIPAFLGYPPGSRHPFPNTLTVCVNEELVHGIPGERTLQEGDIVTIDCGTIYRGFVADSAYTTGVGKISDEAQALIDVTEQALDKAIEQCVPANRLGDVSHAVQAFVESKGYNVVRRYGGHGVGQNMHEEPHIPNYGKPGKGLRLQKGMTLAIEPMVMIGTYDTEVLDDQWTVVSADRKLNAHCEHTVAITEMGPEILTKWS